MSEEPKPVRRRAARGAVRSTVPPEVREQRLRDWYDGFVADRQRRGIPEDGVRMDAGPRGDR